MNVKDITPLILTWNEAPNIGRALTQLQWATQVVVVDSGSSDETAAIAASFPNVRVVTRQFDSFGRQCNFGLDQIDSPWTLSLDADYICSPNLVDELAGLDETYSAYTSQFVYAVFGHPLRGTLYPPRPVLFRTKQFRYWDDGHGHKLDLKAAACGRLRRVIVHDDRKPLSRWLASQAKYASLEADKLLSHPLGELSRVDRIRRRILFAAPLTLIYCLFWKRLILDGWPGIFYSLQRTYAEMVLSLELVDRKLRDKPPAR